MDGIELEHVDHVVEVNEGVVDSNNLDVLKLESITVDNAANTTETVDADFDLDSTTLS
jgi:hypothetical protein